MNEPTGNGAGTNVKVAVRCRPMSQKEIANGYKSIVEFEGESKVIVHDPSESPSDQLGTRSGERLNYSQVYSFNAVFDRSSSQKDVYNSVCQDIVASVMDGYNGTIFAYGQTGTGKTYTMEGNNSLVAGWHHSKKAKRPTRKGRRASGEDVSSKENADNSSKGVDENSEVSIGIIPRAFRHIFDHVGRTKDVQFLIRAAYLEIYQEEIHDLLRKDRSVKLEIHEKPDTGVYVKDLTWYVCKSITEIERVMRVGNQNRMVGATDMNEHSSRSHAIFMITVEQQQQQLASNMMTSKDKQVKTRIEGSGETWRALKSEGVYQSKDRVIRVGKLNLVDLAGSERQRKTNSSGQRQRESIKINLSLSALGNVINSLMKMNINQQAQKQSNNKPINHAGSSNNNLDLVSHIPYRDSKLTRLLQDSLGGNAKTLMITNIGPASYNYDETINTLNYASRAKCIKNRPRLNEDPKDALLRELQRQIEELRNKVANYKPPASKLSTGGRGHDTLEPSARAEQKRESIDAEGDPVARAASRQRVEQELFELRRKLASLEAKLLNSANSYKDDRTSLAPEDLRGYTQAQAQRLEASRAELLDQANRERDIKLELERREELEMMVKQSYSSVQQEVESKRRMIRQILLKIQSTRNQSLSSREAQRVELDELEQLQFVLQRELKLKALIMDNFVPNMHVDKLLSRISYDERQDTCYLSPADLALMPSDSPSSNEEPWSCSAGSISGVSYDQLWAEITKFDGGLRPSCEFQRISDTIYPGNIRYKSDKFVEPRLEIPEQPMIRRFGDEFLSHGPASQDPALDFDLQQLLDKALEENEADLVV